MKEIWKQIEGFPNYQVSNTGKVKVIKKNGESLLNLTDAGQVSLYFEGKRAAVLVKKLVAQYFLGYAGSARHIHLKDGDARNCSLDNIRVDPEVSDRPGEIWKPLVIAPDKYLISSMGRVKALTTPSTYTDSFGTTITKIRKEQLVSIRQSQSGAPTCDLYIGDKEQKITVSIEVAKLFVPNPNNFRWVGFKNGDKSDCRAENLYWYKCSRDAKPVSTSANTETQESSKSEEVNLYTALPCEVKEEIWKTIPGFEDYEISNTGFIRSNANRRPIIRKIRETGVVILRGLEGRVNCPVKWLAVYTFFGKSVSRKSIETLDGNDRNFRLDNLRVTYDEDYPSDEIWAPLRSLHKYQVSNKGRIRALDLSKYLPAPRYFIVHGSTDINKSGNPYIILDPRAETGFSAKIPVAFEIAKMFVPNPNEIYCQYVSFKDGDYTNMSADNLQWVHKADIYNSTDPTKCGLHVVCLETGEYYPAAKMLATELGVHPSRISRHLAEEHKFTYNGKTYILEQDYDKLQEKNS